MNITEYTFLLNKPDAVNNKQTAALEKIVDEFPYFQSARALRLKGLYNEDSFKYNDALKVTAAYTTDRSVLFDFITSDTFIAIQKGLYDQKLQELHDIVVTGIEIVVEAPRKAVLSTSEQSMLTSLQDAGIPVEGSIVTDAEFIAVVPKAENETPEQKLEIGKPLEFSKAEKHSFQEWLQLSQIHPIQREEHFEAPADAVEQEPDEKQKKSELIDRFLEANPKIPPVKQSVNSVFVEPSKSDNTYLMTETLARVYLEQKKYQKAIQAYEILILKYPEKITFFADRILDIKNLQQNNNTL